MDNEHMNAWCILMLWLIWMRHFGFLFVLMALRMHIAYRMCFYNLFCVYGHFLINLPNFVFMNLSHLILDNLNSFILLFEFQLNSVKMCRFCLCKHKNEITINHMDHCTKYCWQLMNQANGFCFSCSAKSQPKIHAHHFRVSMLR